jgi:hypothetical protein
MELRRQGHRPRPGEERTGESSRGNRDSGKIGGNGEVEQAAGRFGADARRSFAAARRGGTAREARCGRFVVRPRVGGGSEHPRTRSLRLLRIALGRAGHALGAGTRPAGGRRGATGHFGHPLAAAHFDAAPPARRQEHHQAEGDGHRSANHVSHAAIMAVGRDHVDGKSGAARQFPSHLRLRSTVALCCEAQKRGSR